MAITDNTAKWQVKKLTNFTDKEREIATQAQAEEGVDNTKIMTPLRVKNAIDKQIPLKTYTTLESIGVDNSATIEELVSMMPINSMLVVSLSRNTMTNISLPLDGTLIATKRDGSRVIFQLVCPDGNYTKYYFGGYAGWTNPKFSGWKQLANNGALSMPSSSQVYIEPPSITSSSTSYNKIKKVYTAPADGWIYINIGGGGSGTQHEAWVNTTGGYKTSLIWSESLNQWLTFPIAKGQTFDFEYRDLSSLKSMYFIYAQSEV